MKNILIEENVFYKVVDMVRKEINVKIIKFYNMGLYIK